MELYSSQIEKKTEAKETDLEEACKVFGWGFRGEIRDLMQIRPM
ncbi:hypothetical protein LINPERPRIM_LOCUS21751, partial [Linum perenne]